MFSRPGSTPHLFAVVVGAIALLGGAAAASAQEVAPHNSIVHRGSHRFVVSTHGDPLTIGGRGHGGGAFAAPIGPAVIQPALASTWCGTEKTSDYTTSSLGGAPAIKVIYAYPTDQHNFNTYKNFIQTGVKAAADRVAGQPGTTKTIRFDLGTDCANPLDYVDIESVALSQNAAHYQGLA